MSTVPPLRHFDPLAEPDPTLRDAALNLAKLGYPILPGQPRAKRPLRAGLKPSTDSSVVAKWWAASPGANPLIDVGGVPVIVLDLDSDQGEAWLSDVLAGIGASRARWRSEPVGVATCGSSWQRTVHRWPTRPVAPEGTLAST